MNYRFTTVWISHTNVCRKCLSVNSLCLYVFKLYIWSLRNYHGLWRTDDWRRLACWILGSRLHSPDWRRRYILLPLDLVLFRGKSVLDFDDQSILATRWKLLKFSRTLYIFKKLEFQNNIFRRRYNFEHSLHAPMFKSSLQTDSIPPYWTRKSS